MTGSSEIKEITRSISFSSCVKLLFPKAFKSGKSIGFFTVPPLCEKLNFKKKKLLFANSLATKFHAPQSLYPL